MAGSSGHQGNDCHSLLEIERADLGRSDVGFGGWYSGWSGSDSDDFAAWWIGVGGPESRDGGDLSVGDATLRIQRIVRGMIERRLGAE